MFENVDASGRWRSLRNFGSDKLRIIIPCCESSSESCTNSDSDCGKSNGLLSISTEKTIFFFIFQAFTRQTTQHINIFMFQIFSEGRCRNIQIAVIKEGKIKLFHDEMYVIKSI